MIWFLVLSILALVVLIFFSTLNITPGIRDNSIWIKVCLQVNEKIQASWCRVIPGHSVKFYTLDGEVINREQARVRVIEPCLDSNVNNPVPMEDLDGISSGTISDAWPRCNNPFSRRS